MNKRSAPINPTISFDPLKKEDFPLVYNWFNRPHIRAFYSLRSWTLEEIDRKLTPYLHGIGEMKCYIISVNQTPIGYIQCYPVKKHPWANQDLADEIVQTSAGIDLFIGEEAFVGMGLGCQILYTFLGNHIWPHYRYCLTDPDINNEASIRFFRKCGFKEYRKIMTEDALHRPVTLQLFIKGRG